MFRSYVDRVQHTEIYYHQKEITQLQCKYIFQQDLSQTAMYIFPPEDGHKTETCSGY
jgi:hypothetical protein